MKTSGRHPDQIGVVRFDCLISVIHRATRVLARRVKEQELKPAPLALCFIYSSSE